MGNKLNKRKKYTQKELALMDAVDVYKLVLCGEISKFPPGFWSSCDSLENAKKCTIFLIEDILNLNNDNQIKEKFNGNLLIGHSLSGMLSKLFSDSPFAVINNAYPDRFKPWEFSQTPIKYWKDKKNRDYALNWFFNEVANPKDENFKYIYDVNLFIKHGLFGLIKNYFNGSPYLVLDYYFPNTFKPWDLKQSPKKYFSSKENRVNAVKWLIEEKLKWNEDEVTNKWNSSLLHEYGLDWCLRYVKGNSHFYLLDEAYPGLYKPWLVTSGIEGFWNVKENRVDAVKWLIEKKLKVKLEDVPKHLTHSHFKEYKLSGLFNIYYNKSIYHAVNEAYPDVFTKSYFYLSRNTF